MNQRQYNVIKEQYYIYFLTLQLASDKYHKE